MTISSLCGRSGIVYSYSIKLRVIVPPAQEALAMIAGWVACILQQATRVLGKLDKYYPLLACSFIGRHCSDGLVRLPPTEHRSRQARERDAEQPVSERGSQLRCLRWSVTQTERVHHASRGGNVAPRGRITSPQIITTYREADKIREQGKRRGKMRDSPSWLIK
jgi:hypothetical protein